MIDQAQKIRLLMELRRGGITDTRVLSAIERLPRTLFVSEVFADRAYDNSALPIAHGQTISQPYVVAFMTQALDLDPRLKVLEIGTGSGYQTAVLAQLCRRVYTIERYPSLLHEAEQRFSEMRLNNITAIVGDGYQGWPQQAPFPRIIVTAAAPEIPPVLVDQLDLGGIMIVPVGDLNGQQILRVLKTEAGTETKELLPVRFVPLVEGVVREG
jgi:protein-L-isoaspartate(D-aspartate) O-methyltransferase